MYSYIYILKKYCSSYVYSVAETVHLTPLSSPTSELEIHLDICMVTIKAFYSILFYWH